jgi:hypothetical protein
MGPIKSQFPIYTTGNVPPPKPLNSKIYEGNKALLEQLQIQKALERLIKERAGYPPFNGSL